MTPEKLARRLRMQLTVLALGGLPAMAVISDSQVEWLADLPHEYALTMSMTARQHGDAAVSLAELASDRAIPKQARQLFEKALKLERKGDQNGAFQQVKAATEVAPSFFQAQAALAIAYLKNRNIDEAERHVAISLKLNPSYLPALEIRGVTLFFRRNFREAVELLNNLVRSAPCRKTIHYVLGRALLESGDALGARRHFEMADMLLRNPPRLPVDVEASSAWPGRPSSVFPRRLH